MALLLVSLFKTKCVLGLSLLDRIRQVTLVQQTLFSSHCRKALPTLFRCHHLKALLTLRSYHCLKVLPALFSSHYLQPSPRLFSCHCLKALQTCPQSPRPVLLATQPLLVKPLSTAEAFLSESPLGFSVHFACSSLSGLTSLSDPLRVSHKQPPKLAQLPLLQARL